MFVRHSVDKLIYPLIAAAIIVAVSFRPIYRLRAEMPAAFFSEANASTARGHAASLEKSIAAAYWESAQNDIQWKFPHGSALPLNPPPEFRVKGQAVGLVASDQVIRQHYWSRLRLVWELPEVWKTEYGWNWSWRGHPLSSASQWIRDTSARLFSFLR
jgi:hypothetical protein